VDLEPIVSQVVEVTYKEVLEGVGDQEMVRFIDSCTGKYRVMAFAVHVVKIYTDAMAVLAGMPYWEHPHPVL